MAHKLFGQKREKKAFGKWVSREKSIAISSHHISIEMAWLDFFFRLLCPNILQESMSFHSCKYIIYIVLQAMVGL